MDSVTDVESHVIKVLAKFPLNPALEILIKIHNCVGSTNMHGRFLINAFFLFISGGL